MTGVLFDRLGFLEPGAVGGEFAEHFALDNDRLLFNDFNDFGLFLNHGDNFDIEGEIGVKLPEGVFDVAFVQAGIFGSGVFEFEFDEVNVFLDFLEGHFVFAGFGDLFTFAVPNNGGFGVSADFTFHNDKLSSLMGRDTWLFDKSWSVSFGFRFSFNIQIKIGVTFAEFVFDMAPVGTTVGSGGILK